MAAKELAGRTALVTGGSRGIGRAVCVRLAREGAGRDQLCAERGGGARGRAAVRAEGAECLIVEADVCPRIWSRHGRATVERGLGPIDLLVTSAGIAPAETRGRGLVRDLATDHRGERRRHVPAGHGGQGRHDRARLRTDRLLRLDRGLRPRPTMLAYSTSKAAVVGLRAAAPRRSRRTSGSTPSRPG